jgi:hypothetical protein
MYIVKINDLRDGANFDLRAIIWTTLVEVYQTMPYARYLCSRPYGSLQEDFFNLFLDSFWLSWQPDFWMERTALKALHPRINPAKFGWNKTSGFSQEDFLSSYIIYKTHKHTYTQTHTHTHTHRWIAICHHIADAAAVA